MIPHQGCVITKEGKLKAIWQSDPGVELQDIPNSTYETATGEKRSLLSPDDIIVDLTSHFHRSEFQLLYKDWNNVVVRRDEQGNWRFFMVYPTLRVNQQQNGLEQGEVFEDEHVVERIRRARLARGAR